MSRRDDVTEGIQQ